MRQTLRCTEREGPREMTERDRGGRGTDWREKRERKPVREETERGGDKDREACQGGAGGTHRQKDRPTDTHTERERDAEPGKRMESRPDRKRTAERATVTRRSRREKKGDDGQRAMPRNRRTGRPRH